MSNQILFFFSVLGAFNGLLLSVYFTLNANNDENTTPALEKIKVKIDFDAKGDNKKIIAQLANRLLFQVDTTLQKDMETILKYDFDPKSENANEAVLRLFNYITKTPEYQLI